MRSREPQEVCISLGAFDDCVLDTEVNHPHVGL